MDTNNKKLEYAQGDLIKGIYTFQDAIKDAKRECKIYKDNYKDYLKSGGVATEENERLKNRVSLIQDKIQQLMQDLKW
jgi:ribosomal protein S16